MTLFYYNPVFQEHVTGDHPENGERIRAVVRHLSFVGLDASCRRPSWQPASVERLCYAHTLKHVEYVQQFATNGGGFIEEDTVVSEKSYEVARLAVGAVCDAVERVVRGEDKNAFCLVRPPGHHAMPEHAMGFCLFNNVAVGARVATRELGAERVLIVDIDVHHGNGTQAIFWEDPRVAYFSIHGSPLYPETGSATEIGAGAGIGTNLNVPIRQGTTREELLKVFERELKSFANDFKPQLVLVSAGFDAHKDNPVGSLGLETHDYQAITRALLDVANEHADGKLVSVLEGGYNPHALSDCVTVHLEELLEEN
ncbi:Histone deacetylase-like amidohydrolase [Rubripirellula lacrimiformis]|uniref:Histone deacetylase-like amidohydrolase n=1 Tax=Rubripirellula lacrimiformis TaxID=1930273 RepID=A0A517N4U8_9BACT|nr:histone deacetylase [Rubripirellula lacrimiformis]QDT02159.1 Histone deacetylase-like amidohydrolase [Rubripirellula lacrimiformis]